MHTIGYNNYAYYSVISILTLFIVIAAYQSISQSRLMNT